MSNDYLLKIFFSNFFLLDESLDGYRISKTLPEPRHYNFRNNNPILAVLADQIFKSGATFDTLLQKVNIVFSEITTGLKNGTIAFPNNPNLLPKDVWIQKMESDMSFYSGFARNADEFKAFDDQLIQIMANYLKSPIKVISFPTGEPKVIHPISETVTSKMYYILSCNTADDYSFTVSIFPEEKS